MEQKIDLITLHQDFKELKADILDLKKEFTRYKGFLGGAVWALGILVAGIQFLFGIYKGNA